MISYIAILICVNLLRSDTYTQADSNILGGENDVNCEEMKQPGWSLFSLANKTLDAWPWSCLNFRYNQTTLHKEVSKLSPGIFDATAKDHIGFVQYYTERRRVDLCKTNRDDENAMHLAVANGYLRIVQYFLTNDFKLRCQLLWAGIRGGNVSPTMYAASCGRLDIFKYLLKEIKKYKLRNPNIRRKPAYINGEDLDDSLYPFASAAVKRGHQHVLEYLVEEEGFVIEPYLGKLLGTAAIGGYVDMLKYLIHEKHMIEDIDATIKKSKDADFYHCDDLTLLCNTATTDNLDAFIYLFETLNFAQLLNYNKKPLWSRLLLVAMRDRSLPVIKYILEKSDGGEKDVSSNILLGFDALLRACNCANAVKDDLKIVQFLVDDMKMISRIDEIDYLNETVAMKAASCKKLSILKFLVDDRHANIAIMPPTNKTLLHFAVSSGGMIPLNMPILKYLIEEKGFKVSARTTTNETVLDIARRTLSLYSRDDRTNLLVYLTEKLRQELSTKNYELVEIIGSCN